MIVHYIGHISRTWPNYAVSSCNAYNGPLVTKGTSQIRGGTTITWVVPNKRWLTFYQSIVRGDIRLCKKCIKIRELRQCINPLCRMGLS
ncbi:hypothetical protein LCGC14_0429540 [marine sediment metagenome]|uniref:Uncharacterized protein n=1 Tax=marine sediment metagenome TaxID=412755 RepID=A0A0F9VXT5_9ZZZZ